MSGHVLFLSCVRYLHETVSNRSGTYRAAWPQGKKFPVEAAVRCESPASLNSAYLAVAFHSIASLNHSNTIQHHTNTAQYNATPTQRNGIQPSTQCNATQHNIIQHNTASQYNTIHYNAIQHGTTQHRTKQYTIQQIRHNTMQYKPIQPNTAHHTTRQRPQFKMPRSTACESCGPNENTFRKSTFAGNQSRYIYLEGATKRGQCGCDRGFISDGTSSCKNRLHTQDMCLHMAPSLFRKKRTFMTGI